MPSISPEQLIDQLQWRYATKAFDPAAIIPEDTWKTIEESLLLTPSSFGLQPWKFLVITDPGTKSALLPHSWNQHQVVDCSHYVVLAAPTDVGEATIDNWIECLAFYRKVTAESLAGYRSVIEGFLANLSPDQRLVWAQRQVYIALGQLMTSAAVLGIDACPMEGFSPAEYDALLDLPDRNLTATVACALGYRADDDKYATTPKARFPRDEVIETIA